MKEPGRRVMEEQEPSGSMTLHWRGERSQAPTEWRLSPWKKGRTHVQLALWQHFNAYFKKMSGLASKKLEAVMALSVLPWRSVQWNPTSALQEVAISRLAPDDREPWDSLRPLLPQ